MRIEYPVLCAKCRGPADEEIACQEALSDEGLYVQNVEEGDAHFGEWMGHYTKIPELAVFDTEMPASAGSDEMDGDVGRQNQPAVLDLFDNGPYNTGMASFGADLFLNGPGSSTPVRSGSFRNELFPAGIPSRIPTKSKELFPDYTWSKKPVRELLPSIIHKIKPVQNPLLSNRVTMSLMKKGPSMFKPKSPANFRKANVAPTTSSKKAQIFGRAKTANRTKGADSLLKDMNKADHGMIVHPNGDQRRHRNRLRIAPSPLAQVTNNIDIANTATQNADAEALANAQMIIDNIPIQQLVDRINGALPTNKMSNSMKRFIAKKKARKQISRDVRRMVFDQQIEEIIGRSSGVEQSAAIQQAEDEFRIEFELDGLTVNFGEVDVEMGDALVGSGLSCGVLLWSR